MLKLHWRNFYKGLLEISNSYFQRSNYFVVYESSDCFDGDGSILLWHFNKQFQTFFFVFSLFTANIIYVGNSMEVTHRTKAVDQCWIIVIQAPGVVLKNWVQVPRFQCRKQVTESLEPLGQYSKCSTNSQTWDQLESPTSPY